MESPIRHPSTVLQYITHRHATEKQAMDKAMGYVEKLIANHLIASPKAVVIESSAEATFMEGRGHSAIVRVRISQ